MADNLFSGLARGIQNSIVMAGEKEERERQKKMIDLQAKLLQMQIDARETASNALNPEPEPMNEQGMVPTPFLNAGQEPIQNKSVLDRLTDSNVMSAMVNAGLVNPMDIAKMQQEQSMMQRQQDMMQQVMGGIFPQQNGVGISSSTDASGAMDMGGIAGQGQPPAGGMNLRGMTIDPVSGEMKLNMGPQKVGDIVRSGSVQYVLDEQGGVMQTLPGESKPEVIEQVNPDGSKTPVIIDTMTGRVIGIGGEGFKTAPSSSETAKAEGEKARSVSQAQKEGEKAGDFGKIRSSYETVVQNTQRTIGTIDRALEKVGVFSAGPAAMLAWVPGSLPKDLKAEIDTIKANIGFNALQEMRANSPTGGALGQVSNIEIMFLQATLASLDQALSPADLTDRLNRVKGEIASSMARIQAAYEIDAKKFGGDMDTTIRSQTPTAKKQKTIKFEDLPE